MRRSSSAVGAIIAVFILLASTLCCGVANDKSAAENTTSDRAQSNAADHFGLVEASGLRWRHLSSRHGDLPVPGESTQQTGCVVADLDKDGVNDFVLSFRQKAPALVWYRHTKTGWDRYVIDKDCLTVEAGGAVLDIDGDGYPDLVFGADWQGGRRLVVAKPRWPLRSERALGAAHDQAAAARISITIRSSAISRGPAGRNSHFGISRPSRC